MGFKISLISFTAARNAVITISVQDCMALIIHRKPCQNVAGDLLDYWIKVMSSCFGYFQISTCTVENVMPLLGKEVKCLS